MLKINNISITFVVFHHSHLIIFGSFLKKYKLFPPAVFSEVCSPCGLSLSIKLWLTPCHPSASVFISPLYAFEMLLMFNG